MHLPSREQLGSIRDHQQRLHGTGVSLPAATSDTPPTTPKRVPPTPNNTPASTPATSATSSPASIVSNSSKKVPSTPNNTPASTPATSATSSPASIVSNSSKKIPPTPNNTPASTPATSATSSPATTVSDSTKKSKKTKKTKKMAKEKKPRTEKRHLVRWSDQMDKTLLLTVQYVCNSAGLAVPWNEIAILMGEGITGGAVIQHLAKLRTRMVTQGLPVPPPLRRGGGGSRISTSTSSGSKKKTAATKNEQTTTPAKSKKAGKKAATGSDESEDDDIFNDNDSDATYGEPRPKRVKSDAKGPMRRNIKIEESDEEVDTPSKPPKRKYQKSSSSRNLSAYGTTDINGVPIGDYSDDEAATDTGLVAGGAPWLALEDDYVNYPNTGMKTPYEKKSLVVTFPTAEMADVLGSVEEEENEDVDDDDSEDEAIGGEIESYGGEAHVLSNEETNQNFSLYNQNFENFPAAQMEPAFGATNQNNMYNDLYHAGSKVAPFDGGYEGSIGADFNFGLASTGFNYQNDDFNAGTGLFRNEDMFVGTVPQNNFGYQSAFDNHIGGLPFSNLQDHPDTIPYQVQTSGDYTSSNDQTPAGTSAGAEIPTGYFSNQFHLPSSNGSDGLFHDENFNGNFGNGSFSSNPYGN